MRNRLALALALSLWSGAAVADDWLRLDAAGIHAALTSRVLGYPDGTLQDFKADGTTLAGRTTGRWAVQGDRYCSIWPPGEVWACFDVDQSPRGLDIRFTDAAGHVTVGRYVDLR